MTQKNKILIFGGAGFIGHHLVNLLQSKHDICVYDNFNIFGITHERIKKQIIQDRTKQWYNVDTVNGSVIGHSLIQDTIDNFKPEIIINLAAYPRVSLSEKYPVLSAEGMVQGLINTMGYDVKKYVHVTTPEVYGSTNEGWIKESINFSPNTPYAVSRAACDLHLLSFYKAYNFPVVFTRAANVFGPGQYGDSPYATAVSAWCHAIKNGLECRSDGDGEQTRDMCYIDNVVHANIQASNCFGPFKGECYNVACGDKVSNNEILDHLKNRFGDKVKVKTAPERAGDVKHTQADISKIRRQIGYTVQKHFWEGLDETIAWWGLDE